MQFDVFFSLSHVPVEGYCPSERQMFLNFFEQVKAADNLGYETAWLAEAHLSSEAQKEHKRPVMSHWDGEVGLMTDFVQVAREIFSRTKHIEVGSAITNILCNGGPIAAAERIAAFANLHGLDPSETRRLHVGFSGGRFEYMNRPFGIEPRDVVEEAAWPALRGLIFREACEIFCRLLRGDLIESNDIPATILSRENFRSDEDWLKVQQAAETKADRIPIRRRYEFEKLRILPREYRRDLIQLVLGSHDAALQKDVNHILPVQVFNLSVTQPEKIEDTHLRMAQDYHQAGGSWKRSYMPRTTFVFLNADSQLTSEEQRKAASTQANRALSAYWKAIEGTVDPQKIENATQNALVGNPEDIIRQMKERFHPDDRLMLWFDFFNHDSEDVISQMTSFMEKVVPSL